MKFKEYLKEGKNAIYNIPSIFFTDVSKRIKELNMYIVDKDPYIHGGRAMMKITLGNTTRQKLNQLELLLDRLDKKNKE